MKTYNKIISIEGIDGAGKTTLTRNLDNYLTEKKYKVGIVSASMSPENKSLISDVDTYLRYVTKSGDLIVDDKTETCTYLARLREKRNLVGKLLKTNDIILIDRYVFTTYVLSIHGRRMDEKIFIPIWDWVVDGLWPIATIICDLSDHKIGTKRKIGSEPLSRTEKEDDNYRNRILKGFRDLPNKHPNHKFEFIDTSENSIQDIFENATRLIGQYI